MIIGIGIDIVYVPSFSKKLENPAFIERVFSAQEIAYCSEFNKSSERFAGKFAAKEAFMKAIGLGIQQEIWFSQIEISNNQAGAPILNLYGKAHKICTDKQIESIHLSISHNQNSAVAIVILEK